jgi:hypothetical protein
MNDKRIKQFYRFLKENNIYKAYRINFDKEYSCSDSLSKFLRISLDDEVIFEAFCWQGTPEGGNFWADICDEWDEYVEKIRKDERSRNKKI